MKLEVLLTYDDRKVLKGSKPVRYHRQAIGFEGVEEKSIYTHIFPNPNKWNQLVIYFKDGVDILAVAKFELEEPLVASNKNRLTKLGEELVLAGLENKIKEVYNGENATNPIVNHLKPEHFAQLIFDFNEDNLVFSSGTIKLINSSFPKGLSLNPKVELKI